MTRAILRQPAGPERVCVSVSLCEHAFHQFRPGCADVPTFVSVLLDASTPSS